MFEPLVSIIIPVYNGANYMREAIESALNQTYRNIEVIVINDGSSDDGESDRVARSYGERIRYFYKENGGVSSALNLGIEKMKGEYFSWLSHDDVYDLNKIKKQIDALNNLENKDTIIYCNYCHINNKSELVKKRRSIPYFNDRVRYGWNDVLKGLLKDVTLNGCCLLIKKDLLLNAGKFDEKLRFCQDAMMWYKIFINKNDFYYISEALVKNRIHDQQLTQKGQKLFKEECNNISKYLSDQFARISTKNENFIQLYLIREAKYLEWNSLKYVLTIGKEKDLISIQNLLQSIIIFVYGKFRPMMRKIYYSIKQI